MSPKVLAERATIDLPGPIAGVGIDLLQHGRVSPAVAGRVFGDAERERFRECPELPFAAREAIVKAVGGPGIPGAPLRAMEIAWEEGRLVLRPGPAYAAVLAERGVEAVLLTHVAALSDAALVLALAVARGAPSRARTAWALVHVEDADEGVLSAAERASARSRADARPSIAARHAAHVAARELFGDTPVEVLGGAGAPPTLAGAPGARVLLSHDAGFGAAFVAAPAE